MIWLKDVIYPVHCAIWKQIQSTRSAYPYHLICLKVMQHYSRELLWQRSSVLLAHRSLSCVHFFVMTVHWWRHKTYLNMAEAYRALRNILAVDLNNRGTRAGDFNAILLINRYGINPYSYSGFLWVKCSLRDIEQRLSALGLHLTVRSLGRRHHTSMDK